MMLLWDGLQVEIPKGMEPAALDRGFIRLIGSKMPTVSLRFSSEKCMFDPHRDGRRILRAAGIAQEALRMCDETWTKQIPGDLYRSNRLWVVQFSESRAVLAVLFSAPPPAGMAETILASLAWTPAEAWRRWHCYDITFETPPDYLLKTAVFQPGRFLLKFTNGRSELTFDRLAPANVLLTGMTFMPWCEQNMSRNLGRTIEMHRGSNTEVDMGARPSPLYRLLPWLPGQSPPLQGKARHIPEENKILILAEQGPPLPAEMSSRLHEKYEIIPSFKT